MVNDTALAFGGSQVIPKSLARVVMNDRLVLTSSLGTKAVYIHLLIQSAAPRVMLSAKRKVQFINLRRNPLFFLR